MDACCVTFRRHYRRGLVPGVLAPAEISQSVETNVATGNFLELFRDPIFRHVIAISALVFSSHAMHNAFAVIRWSAAGISPITTSLLWSEAVVSEVVVFFLFGPLIVKRFGSRGAAALAAIAGIARWTVMSQTTDVAALALVQPLHGCTFALLHLATSMYAIDRRLSLAPARGHCPEYLRLWFCDCFYEQLGAIGFLAMALLCGLAIPIALSLPRAKSH